MLALILPVGSPHCRLVTVRNADMIVVMHAGEVAEVGRHDELVRQGGIYASLVQRQSGGLTRADADMAPHAPPPVRPQSLDAEA